MSGIFGGVTLVQPEIGVSDPPEEVITIEGSDWRCLLSEYVRLVADRMNVCLTDVGDNVTGYCSWYYYYHNVTESQFFENLSELANRSDVFPVKYAQIDDGYQAHHGDWLDRNSNWQTPLAEVASRIRGLGFEGRLVYGLCHSSHQLEAASGNTETGL